MTSRPLRTLNFNSQSSVPSPLTLLPSTLNGVDWEKCFICQKVKAEALICPALNPIKEKAGSGYKTFYQNLLEFQKIGGLPRHLQSENVRPGQDIGVLLLQKQAKWHRTCNLLYNNTQLERAKKRKRSFSLPSATSKKDTISSLTLEEKRPRRSRSTSSSTNAQVDVCFICKEKGTTRKVLHKVSSFQDEKLKKCAEKVNKVELKAYLVGGDLIAKGAKYHLVCYNDLIKHDRPTKSTGKMKEEEINSDCKNKAFASVAHYISEKFKASENSKTDVALKMPDLQKVYDESLANLLELKVTDISHTHSTRLRNRILDHFPELKAELSGSEYILYRKGAINHQCFSEDLDKDAISCYRYLKKIREDISKKSVIFNGTLDSKQLISECPESLRAIVNYLLFGDSSVNDSNSATQAAVTISQLIVFNYKESVPSGQIIRHSKMREPQIPLYVGLSLYGKTRSATMIDNMHELGLSIASSRVREITTGLSYVAVQRAKEEDVVCPSNLLHGLFTVGAYDNLDHNFSSSTSESSFHGTTISIFQIPSRGQIGKPRAFTPDPSPINQNDKKLPELPESFSVVKEITLNTKEPNITRADIDDCSQIVDICLGSEWKLEKEWLEHVNAEGRPEPLNLSWAAYHASTEDPASSPEIALSSLLPLFSESSSSPSMIKHALDQLKKITHFLNPGQTPVLCLDQPLYTLTKIVQWNWPDIYGESKYVTMFASFHIEQAFLRVIGQLLFYSGWTGIVANSGVKTEAGADACLRVTHVMKSRAIHEKTSAVLYSLLKDAYVQAKTPVPFDDWVKSKAAICPTFQFWLIVLNLEILLLCFVRSLRTGNYQLFMETLKKMVPWFFVTDHLNYARWLSVHIKDLQELEKKAPDIFSSFCNGQFVIRKTSNPFSALAIDQAHEQNNALVKEEGGAVGLLQDPAMLRRWILAGPQLTNILNDFESSGKSTIPPTQSFHHEQYSAYQKKFHEHIKAIKKSFLEYGNPFEDNSSDLLVWDSKVCMDTERIKNLRDIEKKAVELYSEYVEERLSANGTVSVFAAMKKTGTILFGPKRTKVSTSVVSNLKNDVELFSRAFIASQNRNLDLDTFFEYENTSTPPSLSSDGVLRECQKSQLLTILEKIVESAHYQGTSNAIIYDGAALVHTTPPSTSKTFQEYFNREFKQKILSDLEKFQPEKLHISWDTYSPMDLKTYVRKRRGLGLRRKVAANNTLPPNWKEFLSCDENKSELFLFLGERILSSIPSIHVITEIDGVIQSSLPKNTSIEKLQCRREEETDGRIFLHAKDSVQHGARKLIICTGDTDVVVLAVSYFAELQSDGLEEMWIRFGHGKNQRFMNVRGIYEKLGREKSIALRGFHAFTGCDLTSSFALKGKLSTWNAWKSFPQATKAFVYLGLPHDTISEEIFQILEQFTTYLYYNEKDTISINQARKLLFTSKNRCIQNLPPTREALRQHCLRVAYQAGQVWGRACSHTDRIPGPEGWGWTFTKENWTPIWSTQPPIWKACRELVKCGCRSGCTGRCSCSKAKVPCTLLCSNCQLNENCNNKYNTGDDPEEQDA